MAVSTEGGNIESKDYMFHLHRVRCGSFMKTGMNEMLGMTK